MPQRYWDLYRDSDIDMPAPAIAPDALDPHSRRLRHVCAMDAEPVTEAQVRDARHAYYGAIAYIDDLLGRLMAALRSAGLAEDTIVVLTSDHGEMLGERGLWYKMSFFEGASRVPLVIANPGRFAPRRVAASVSLVDLMPTLIDISGGNAQSLGIAIDGRSLAPHLGGGAGHDEAIGEYLAEGAIAPIVMIRRGAFKFIHSPADPDQLYDLSRDPGERDNLAGKVEHAPRSPPFAPRSPSAGTWPRWTPACAQSQRRRRLVDAALNKGEHRSWDFQPFRDASQQYMRNTMDLDDLEAMARFPEQAGRRIRPQESGWRTRIRDARRVLKRQLSEIGDDRCCTARDDGARMGTSGSALAAVGRIVLLRRRGHQGDPAADAGHAAGRSRGGAACG